jgi:hypothetical protein
MSFRLSRVAGAAALACAASALSLPLARPAQAVTAPVEKAFVVADVNHDGFYSLYTRTPGSSALTAVVGEDVPVDIHNLSSSADGSRVIYVQDNYSEVTGDPVSTAVVVRDVSGRVVKVLDKRAWDDANYLGAPALSPDGTKAVWELYNGPQDRVFIRKTSTDIGTGSVTTLASDLSPYGFLDATTILAQDIDGAPSTVTLGGLKGTVSGLPASALDVAIDPDRQHLAWGDFVSNTNAPMKIGTFSLTGANATVTADAVPLTSTGFNSEPSFSRDGAKVYWVQSASGEVLSPGDIWVRPYDKTTGAVRDGLTSGADEQDLALATTDDGTKPGAITSVAPAVLKGTQASFSWTLPAGSDLSGTVVTRKHGTDKPVTTYLPAPLHAFTSTGLVLGQTYSFTVQPVDRSNNFGAFATRTLTALQAAPVVADPVSKVSTKPSFPVTFGPVAPAGTVFTVTEVHAGATTGGTTWLTNATGRTHTFNGVAGNSYTFRVTAKDGHGNSTPTVSSIRAVVPLDQTKASISGGSTLSNASAWMGSYKRIRSKSNLARITLTGNRLSIIGLTCSTCGTFDIWDNGKWIGGFSTYGSKALRKPVLTKYYTSVSTHSYTIRPRGTSGHPDVVLDGFAMRR